MNDNVRYELFQETLQLFQFEAQLTESMGWQYDTMEPLSPIVSTTAGEEHSIQGAHVYSSVHLSGQVNTGRLFQFLPLEHDRDRAEDRLRDSVRRDQKRLWFEDVNHRNRLEELSLSRLRSSS